jgi:uncharacterized protein YbjQ (UPF0145 family)
MINREDLLSGTRPEVGSRILVTEQEGFQGYEVMDYKGMVWGISMRAKDVVQDMFMGVKQFIGGELSSYTELSDEARQKALDRMLASARRIGANAVINFRFEISKSIYGGNAEVVAYGNAVVIRPIKHYVPTGGLGNIIAEFVDAYTAGKNISTSVETKKDKASLTGEIIENNGYKFVICPHCKTKYKVDVDENGNNHIKGLQDVDNTEPGTQIYCLKCGTKFTIPEVK